MAVVLTLGVDSASQEQVNLLDDRVGEGTTAAPTLVA
jgi:hypothetical protein